MVEMINHVVRKVELMLFNYIDIASKWDSELGCWLRRAQGSREESAVRDPGLRREGSAWLRLYTSGF